MTGNGNDFYWKRSWLADGQTEFPRDYLVVDTETSGLKEGRDHILQVALIDVRNGEISRRESRLLNWLAEPRAPVNDILRRLAYVRKRMETDVYSDATGTNFDFDVERLRQGNSPRDVLEWIRRELFEARRDRRLVVGHFLPFDERMLGAMFERYLGSVDFSLGDRYLFDTLALARSLLSVKSFRPRPGEWPRTYLSRLARDRGPLREGAPNCKLATCVDLFDLSGVDVKRMHTEADEDCLACHRLLERQRDRIRLIP